MAHRLLHTLVFSSVLALDSVGCSLSHASEDAGASIAPSDAAAPSEPDAEAFVPDAGLVIDTGPPDSGLPDSGPTDSGPQDAGSPDAGTEDLRFCEPGWPTTKATICLEIAASEDVRCCDSFWLADGGLHHRDCCIGRAGE